jgi:hypothetical protein
MVMDKKDKKDKKKLFMDFARIHFGLFDDVFCDFVGTRYIFEEY